MTAEQKVKQKYPDAHCAPYSNANYPKFYVIREDRREWAFSIGEGPTPEAAWESALARMEATHE